MLFQFISKCLLLLLLGQVAYLSVFGQQLADTAYRFKVSTPKYSNGKGPVILFDEAHGNPVSLKGLYYGFNKLLSEDGYVLLSAKDKVADSLLRKAKIYVSVNAMADPSNWDLPVRSAYSNPEIKTINRWVSDGGSLLLITDHMPCGGSVAKLAASFGFNIFNGFALRKDHGPEIFAVKKGNLSDCIITKNRNYTIDSIRIWGGTAFIPPADAKIISSLNAEYTVYLPQKADDVNSPIADTIPRISGLGLTCGAFLKYGKGRILIFADAAGFTAQLEGIKSQKRGMNHPDAHQNAPFLLNVIHWLDGLLEK